MVSESSDVSLAVARRIADRLMVAASESLDSSILVLALETSEVSLAAPSPSFCEGNAAREVPEASCEVASV